MNVHKRIEYQHSLPIFIVKTLAMLVLASIFIFCSYILIIKGFYVIIIAFIWLLFGLLFRDAIPKIIRTGRNILNGTPALILTEEMLVDNINCKQLNWNEIQTIDEYYDVRTGSYIAISVKSPTDHMNSEKSFFDRTIMRFNEKYFNGIFALRPIEIRCKKNELLQSLKSFLALNQEK
jgi:hypothetical protein